MTLCPQVPCKPKPLRQYPFVIIQDTREQCPFRFSPRARVVVDTLAVGDYSIRGAEDKIVIERKTEEDLLGSLTHGRERFERELKALRRCQIAVLMVETSWANLIGGRYRSLMNTNSAIGSVMSFVLDYGVLPMFVDSHRVGGILTEKLLYLYHKRINDQGKKIARGLQKDVRKLGEGKLPS